MATAAINAGTTASTTSDEQAPLGFWHRPWVAVLLLGAFVWLLAVVITGITNDTILVPTVILAGSFLAPITAVTWAWGRVNKLNITAEHLFVSFLAGGLLGMVTAALVETYLLPSQTGTFLTVGLIEETAKGTVLYFVARTLKKRTVRDGLLLGATVGAGFAAFESAGYAFDAFNGAGQAGRPLLNVMQTEITRALLSPFGHIAWTALLGGALFAAAGSTGKLRLTGKVWATFAGIVAIHALWDASYGAGIVLTKWFTGDGFHFVWPNADSWVVSPSRNQLIVFDVTYNGILVLLSIVATTWIIHVYRHAEPSTEGGTSNTSLEPTTGALAAG